MNVIARAEAEAEPNPESDLDSPTIEAHLNSTFPHLVQPRRVGPTEPKVDSDAEPEPEPELDRESIDKLLRTTLNRFLQLPRSLPLPSLALVRPFSLKHEHIPRSERCMGQGDILRRYISQDTAPNVPKAEVIDSVDAHEQSVGVGRTDKDCAICYTYVTVGPLTSAPPCGHLFHAECLQEAIRVDPNDEEKHVQKDCPVCRGVFPGTHG